MSATSPIQPRSGRLAKHTLPLRPQTLLRRRRLLEFLHEHIHRKLLLISAAAGYGKTSLLVDFAHDTDLPVAWLSLDESDRDLSAFLADWLEALRVPFPGFGQAVEAVLRESAPDKPEHLAHALGREIESRLDGYFILCLDDYHLVEASEPVARFMDCWLDVQPEHAHLLVASRTLPPFPIAPLAARQEIAGLSEEHLRFTPGEVQALLRLRNEIALPEAEAEALTSRTEGWITGILLSSYLMWQGLVASWIRAQRAEAPVYDYLADQVLAGLPEPLRDFLLESAVLPEMDAETCDAVLGRRDSATMLHQAESQRLFITGTGDEVRSYLYHHLFREFLLSRLQAVNPQRLRELQRRAGERYEAEGRPEVALTFFLNAGELRRAIAVAEGQAEALFYLGRQDTLRQWGRQLAECSIDTPTLLLHLAKVQLDAGEVAAAEATLSRAETGYARNGDARGGVSVALQRALMAYRQGWYEQALALSESGRRQACAGVLPQHAATAARYSGLCHFSLGDLGAAQDALVQAAAEYAAVGCHYDRAWTLHDLARVQRAAGQTARAAVAQQEALAIWRERGNAGPLAMALNNVALDQHMLGQYEAALGTYVEALEQARRAGSEPVEVAVLAGQADLLSDLGDGETAAGLYGRATAKANSMRDADLLGYLYRAQSRLARWSGDLAGALEWLRRAELMAASPQATSPGTGAPALRGAVLLEMGQSEQARVVLLQACAGLQSTGAMVDLALGRFFLAVAEHRCGATDRALEQLRQAFALAEHVGYSQMLVAEAHTARDLLNAALDVPDLLARVAALLSRADAARQVASGLRGRHAQVAQRPPSIEVRSLGGSRVLRDGVEMGRGDWISQQTRELFLYLVDNAPVERDTVLGVFWPDRPTARAASNFHQTLYRMRRALGREVVVFAEGRYRLAPGLDVAYDVALFEEHMRLAEGIPLGDPRRAGALAAAVRRYTGDYLADLPVEWAAARRQALSERFVCALAAMADELMRLTRYGEARQALERALAADPLRDELHISMMRCLGAMGRRHEVVRHYQRYRETLRTELGLEPPAEARALYGRLIA